MLKRAVAQAIGKLIAGSIIGNVAAEHGRVRKPAARSVNARHLPAAKHTIHNRVGVAEQAVAVTDGQCIHRADRHDVLQVEVTRSVVARQQTDLRWSALV